VVRHPGSFVYIPRTPSSQDALGSLEVLQRTETDSDFAQFEFRSSFHFDHFLDQARGEDLLDRSRLLGVDATAVSVPWM
jgi:hypothetical protein